MADTNPNAASRGADERAGDTAQLARDRWPQPNDDRVGPAGERRRHAGHRIQVSVQEASVVWLDGLEA